jgi:hypothetical protein
MTMDFFIGLDLGQAQDPTALAVLERPRDNSREFDENNEAFLPNTYLLRHLQRWPLGTAYTTIVADLGNMVGCKPLRGKGVLGVDATGVGRPVVELLRSPPLPVRLAPITIIGGHATTILADGSVHLPKKELVSTLQVLLQSRRLRIAKSLPDAEVLVREMQNFKVKITTATNEVFEAWREGDHDDLVLAVAIAAWLGENQPRPYTGPLVWWPPDGNDLDNLLCVQTSVGGVLLDLEDDW